MPLHGALGERELVGGGADGALVFNARLHSAGGRAVGCGHLCHGRCACQFAAEFVEVTALGRNDLARLFDRSGLCLGRVWQLQHGSRLQAVDVALDKGFRVGAHQRHQHLVQRDAGQAVAAGDATSGVARPYGNAVGLAALFCFWRRTRTGQLGASRHRAVDFGLGARCAGGCSIDGRGGHRRRCGGRRWSRRRAGRGGCCCGGLWCGDLCGRSYGNRWAAQRWRIEQHGVAARDAACAPGGINDQIHKRIIDRAVAGQAQHHAAIGAALQLHLHLGDCGGVFHALAAKHFWRCRAGAQGVGLCRGDLGQVYLGTQRFTERGLHRDRAQGQGRGVSGVQAKGRHDRSRQRRVFPTMHGCHQLIRSGRSGQAA